LTSEGGPRIAIIGSGFAGLCLAMRLSQAGFRRFTLFEKSDRLGGTWRDNTYPGAACDSPSMAYCFSFEQKTDWSRKWAPQPEILAYMEHCAEKYGLQPHIRFDSEVATAHFDADAGVWNLRTTSGEEHTAEILVSCVGQLNRPHVPEIPGLEGFAGPCFHSARWDHDVDLRGKKVAVIGNAASAIQFIPRVAEQAAELRIFQRSANWMIPKFDREFTDAEKRRFTRHPWLARLYRWWLWFSFELRWPVFRRNRFLGSRIERMALSDMQEHVTDPELRKALVPDYPIGGKRILISDDYYAALARPDVKVVTTGVDRVDEHGVFDRDGTHHAADVLILATGFESTSFLVPMKIAGLDSRSLEAEWKDGARAYLGITVAGFPNFFMMYGPNTNLGHNSILFMLECQTRYILDCIRAIENRDLAWISPRQDVMDAYNEDIQRELERTVWAQTGKSWYKTEDGKITNNWSGTTTRYWWKTRKADLGAYHQVPRRR
jgi:cation diffusion facilitator CzcD-associated flavoprotein CzcO